ncbi:MAG: ParA family protein [Candidatus Sedimenticola sp. (ex Thyasira tokunagai)]
MGNIVAFLSQKGGVGKSTLARAFATEASKAGLSVMIADLDVQQGTVTQWHLNRERNGHRRIGMVSSFGKVSEALPFADQYDYLVLDGAPRASSAGFEIAKSADLIVLPSGASMDDLMPAILLAHEFMKKGVELNRLVMALTKVQTKAEIEDAIEYISNAGYKILDGHLPEKPGYRQAQNEGLAVTETRFKSLNEKADQLIQSIINAL